MTAVRKKRIIRLSAVVIAVILIGLLWQFSRSMLPEEIALRNEMVSIAQTYLGCNEKDRTHEPIIDFYNTQEKLPRSYAVAYDDSWCATFVSVVAMQSAMADWIPTECSCQELIALMNKSGNWEENDWYIPQKGDLIFYAWGEFPLGECTGWADHVGIVAGVYGPIIKVIEGNRNDSVAYHYVWIGHPQIRGYGLPDYRKAGNSGITPGTE